MRPKYEGEYQKRRGNCEAGPYPDSGASGCRCSGWKRLLAGAVGRQRLICGTACGGSTRWLRDGTCLLLGAPVKFGDVTTGDQIDPGRRAGASGVELRQSTPDVVGPYTN